jgi:hypothetical protein
MKPWQRIIFREHTDTDLAGLQLWSQLKTWKWTWLQINSTTTSFCLGLTTTNICKDLEEVVLPGPQIKGVLTSVPAVDPETTL